MADLTHGAVDSLLGLLGSALKDEVKLLSGVKGDIQFIKDEMDSMNGFLLHLTKTETEHNDQHRAWMKQVCDIAYIAQDYIQLYKRDQAPPGGGLCAKVLHLPTRLRACPTRRNLASQIKELKDRVREVGERRLRYGVSVPDARPKPEPARKDSKAEENKEKFLRALEDPSPTSLSTAISLLPTGGYSPEFEISGILDPYKQHHVDSMKMLLRALYAYPLRTKQDVENLKNKLEGSAGVRKEVMVFCYSKLSTQQKKCLQYLAAFLEESSISRTVLVRRWVAEGLVVNNEGLQSLEEAGERCFSELVFRGFVRPAAPVVPGLKIKSCCMEDWVRDFVVDITKSENFVAEALPAHLQYQVEIRKIAQRQPPKEPRKQGMTSLCNICTRKSPPQADDDSMAEEDKQHPMDIMMCFLKTLPEEYRLNVLDLGGCSTLKDHHLKSIICKKVLWLKYLSLRNTNVSRLPKAINNLRQLETLDIRQTTMPPIATAHINLPKLKHLLAWAGEDTKRAMEMPYKIGASMDMEVLRHVQISHGKAELDKLVGHLKQLRKLGVVLEDSEDNIKHLLRTISKLSECLRSLSVIFNKSKADNGSLNPKDEWFRTPKYLKSLNINGSLPCWIEGLDRLSKITLHETQLSQKSLQTLGRLESLCCLRLRDSSYTDVIINLENEEFPKLRFLLIDHVTPPIKIEFHDGAAPKLEKITWAFDKIEFTADITISGISNLKSLEELELCGEWSDHGHHLKQALDAHRKKHHLLRCSFPSSIFEGKSGPRGSY